MGSEITQNVACNNYYNFQHVKTSYFHKISFHYFEDYFTDKTDLRVR